MFKFQGVEGIIFDLDDTLVSASLDFAKIKAEIGCAVDIDILSFIDQIESEAQRIMAQQRVLRYELEDALTSVMIDGALDFILRAKRQNIPMAIVTRNCRAATKVKLEKNKIPIDLVLTREDAKPKPHPEALLQIAQKWQLPTHEIAYIGDYIYDIQAAHNAKMQAWLFKDSTKIVQYERRLSQILKSH